VIFRLFRQQRSFYYLLILPLFFACKTKKTVTKESDYQPYTNIDFGEVKIVAHPAYKGTATKYFDITHMVLDITPEWKTRHIIGAATLTLSPHSYPQDSLILDAKDFIIKRVELVNEGRDSFAELKYHYDNRKLNILLNPTIVYTTDRIGESVTTSRYENHHSYLPGDTFQIKIEYIAKPEDIRKDSIVTKSDEQGMYFINPDGIDSGIPREMWSQGEVNNNCGWFPTIDEPEQKFTHEINITVDTALTTLSNGNLDYTSLNKNGTKTDHWSMDLPHSSYLVMAAAGTYKMVEDNWRDSIPVNYYVEPQYAPYARKIFGNTPAMIEYFSKLLKYDYPWQKYSQMVVRDFTSGAMENTTATLMYEAMQQDDRSLLDNTEEEVISHELFHHWFGDLATCKNWANLAMNESFACYSEARWAEHKYGKDAADLMLKHDLDVYLTEANFHKAPIIEHYYDDPDDLFDHHRYEKGALVLNMLRNYLGDTVFFAALHNYLVANAYKNVELSDLREAMEKASGEDLHWFFEEWFEKPGHPVLEISQEYKEKEGKLYLYIKQTQKDEKVPIFKMKVRIMLDEPFYYKNIDNELAKSTGISFRTIWIKNAQDTFIFKCNKPENIIFDCDNILLCQKTEIKPVKQWKNQWIGGAIRKNFQTRYDALLAISKMHNELTNEEYFDIIALALNDKFWAIRRQAIMIAQNSPDSVSKALIPQIEQIAQKDPDSKVRSTALYFLMEKVGAKDLDIYKNALKDSSYLVLSTAIRAVYASMPRADSASLIKMISPYENLTHGTDVMLSLADIYAKYGGADKIWFFRKLRGYANQFYDDYKHFLFRMDYNVIATQKSFILGLDSYSKEAWILSAYQSFLYEMAKNLQQRNDPRNKENNNRLADEFMAKAKSIKVKF